MSRIFYFGYYLANIDLDDNRYFVPSATNKMTYIASVLADQGHKVTIVSASDALNTIRKRKISVLNEHLSVQYFLSLGRNNKFVKAFSKLITQLQILAYVIMHIKAEDKVIIYHSLGYMGLFTFLSLIKRITFVLEVEEIYSDVTNDEKKKSEEMRYFDRANAFIFASESLNNIINCDKKPFVIVYGIYSSEAKDVIVNKLWDDGLIHIVYAGTLDPRKGGATMAVRAANFLPNNYCIHILGFGKDEDVINIKDEINVLNNDACKVVFEGVKNGNEYVNCLMNCNIGLSTQIIGEKFNESSFPSKVLSYLANGLRVVSARIPVLELSKVNDVLTYYEENSPKALADAIMSVCFDDGISHNLVVDKLDQEFRNDINCMISSL